MHKYTNHRIPPKSPHITHNALTNTKIRGTPNKLKFEHPQNSGFVKFFQNSLCGIKNSGQLIVAKIGGA